MELVDQALLERIYGIVSFEVVLADMEETAQTAYTIIYSSGVM